MRSRFNQRGIGAQVFQTQTPTCPPGQHWVPDATPIRGISACVPNPVIHLQLRPPPAPAPAAPVVVKLAPAVYAPAVATTPPPTVQTFPAPPGPDYAAAPAPPMAIVTTCPEPWPWWWLVVAAAGGAFAGHLIKKDKNKVKKNASRIVNALGGRAVNRAVDRVFG